MCLHLLSCFLPPVAVCFKRGIGCDCCVNLLLTILGFLPGMCHACYIVSQDDGMVVNQTVIMQPQAQPQSTFVTVNIPN
ncbi:Plasma membrane proteolipid 3 [Orchesella cincta]|uniref:Plasma membrane proteolipid 3 n=1 Tax=Orchesella cincta TaxID=48709 RepID=A0A1D2MZZ7_ORCCI|nr:Plasma membrane proteolipid 3 [Orchesella cincta]